MSEPPSNNQQLNFYTNADGDRFSRYGEKGLWTRLSPFPSQRPSAESGTPVCTSFSIQALETNKIVDDSQLPSFREAFPNGGYTSTSFTLVS